MRHLYQLIFVTIVGVAVACGALAVVAARLFGGFDHMPPVVYETARYLAMDLPDEPHALRRELRRRARRSRVAMALWSPEGRLLARSGPRLPRPDPSRGGAYWFKSHRHVGVVLTLDDGRRLAVAKPHRRHHPGLPRLLLACALLLVFVLFGSYWAARRITRRLELLGEGVRKLGHEPRTAQVQVEGRDELAELAAEFNATSTRIAQLLEQQERVLAGASHELRSPLTRLRMALELLVEAEGLPAERRAALRRECQRDIEELDALVDDILLGARLRDRQAERRFSRVDLRELTAAEAGRAGARAQLARCELEGDARALRSLVRNLLDNAQRYGEPPIDVRLESRADGATLSIEDAGEPIPVAERQRIFEPFFRPYGRPEGQGGAGLGLALVRDIARHHGGDVRYEVSPRGGSRFVVELASGAART